MKKYIYFFMIIILGIGILGACTSNSGFEEVNEITLENITDKEIIEFLEEVKSVEKEIANSFDMEDNKSISLNQGGSKITKVAYRAKSPYETPENRENEYSKYYLDTPRVGLLSESSNYSETVDFTNMMIEKDGKYYFIPSAEDIYTYTYKRVLSKKIVNNTLRTEIEIENYGDEYTEIIYFILLDGKLKIDNRIKNEIGSDLKNITDDEILSLIKDARRLFVKVFLDFDVEDKISINNIDGTTQTFFKTVAPYNTPENREEAMKEFYVNYNELSKLYEKNYTVDEANNTLSLYKNGDDYYVNIIQPSIEDRAVYNEVVNKEFIDDKLSVTLRTFIIDSYTYRKYVLVLENNKIKILETKIVNKPEENKKEYSIVMNTISDNVREVFSNVKGNYSIAFKDINEKDLLSINSSKVPAASTIKIYVMIEAYNQINQEKLSLNDKITLNDTMKVEGSGTLKNELAGSEYTIEDLIKLMMVQSDNTAANILIDKLGMDNVNKTIKSLGCVDTELNRKMMDMDALNNGIDNYTSVNDLSLTLNKLYNSECVNSNYDNIMLDIMKGHQLKSKIPNKLPEGTIVAHKSGEMNGIENDAAIVYTDKGDYILCILTDSGTSNEQTIAISDISREIYDKFMEYKGE